jgi:hypothetical protein
MAECWELESLNSKLYLSSRISLFSRKLLQQQIVDLLHYSIGSYVQWVDFHAILDGGFLDAIVSRIILIICAGVDWWIRVRVF